MTVFVSDTMTDSDGVLLQNHAPETGGAWTKVSGTDTAITSNKLAGAGLVAYYINAAVPGNAEYDIQCDLLVVGTHNIYLLARFADASNFYFGRHIGVGAFEKYQFYKVIGGFFTKLDELDEAMPDSSEKVFKVEIRDAAKKIFFDGNEKTTTADNSLAAAGVVGLFLAQAATTIDNFLANDTGAPVSTNASMQAVKTWWQRD